MNAHISVRAASAEDLDAVLTLQRRYPQVVTWSDAAWADLLGGEDLPLRRVWVAETAATLVGFVVLSVVAEVAEFEMVLVDETARGRGTGRELCNAAMQWAAARGATNIQLEVRESNAAARALYASLGFAEQGVRRNYYRHPAEDAVLMGVTL